jgi:hypothetical protein
VRYGSKVQAQAVVSQSSFYSSNDPRLHFGLGVSRTADIEVHWPNGVLEQFPGVKSNQWLKLREGSGVRPTGGKGNRSTK